jgi:hypothetical protein
MEIPNVQNQLEEVKTDKNDNFENKTTNEFPHQKKVDDTPSSSNNNSDTKVKDLIDSINQNQTNLSNKWANGKLLINNSLGDDTPFQKLLSQLSTEMLKTSTEQQNKIKQQVETEKSQLKIECYQLQVKMKQDQIDRETFQQVGK